jgi:pyruvate dehydrogenase E2 component (dihydrolipoamide acetyltransferase)
MVLASDVRPGAATPAPAPAPAAAAAQLPAVAKEVPFSGIRKIIADRMRKSLATTAQLSMHSTADASAMLAFRERIKCSGEALGLPNITLNDIVLFAVARTLARFPDLNAHCVGEKVVLLPEVNLGVAMETPRGLMVPVLRGANRLSLPEISRQVKPMTDAARKGAISPDLLTGGTFTVTNMGMLGVESFTPILNVPEVAILGVGGLTLRAVGTPHAVRYVQTIGLSLTVDHQAVDGAPGARFLKALAEALENFDLILAAEGRGA